MTKINNCFQSGRLIYWVLQSLTSFGKIRKAAMSATLLKIHPENPSLQRIDRVVNSLKAGGIVIYPTDTVYALGCDLYNKRAVEKLCRMKGVKPGRMNLSFICYDLSNVSEYAAGITTPIFKVMKKAIPGPYTFILKANSKVPRIFDTNKQLSHNFVIPRHHSQPSKQP